MFYCIVPVLARHFGRHIILWKKERMMCGYAVAAIYDPAADNVDDADPINIFLEDVYFKRLGFESNKVKDHIMANVLEFRRNGSSEDAVELIDLTNVPTPREVEPIYVNNDVESSYDSDDSAHNKVITLNKKWRNMALEYGEDCYTGISNKFTKLVSFWNTIKVSTRLLSATIKVGDSVILAKRRADANRYFYAGAFEISMGKRRKSKCHFVVFDKQQKDRLFKVTCSDILGVLKICCVV